jgi:hypothetical protein
LVSYSVLPENSLPSLACDEVSHEAAEAAAVFQPVGKTREERMGPFLPSAWSEFFSAPGTNQVIAHINQIAFEETPPGQSICKPILTQNPLNGGSLFYLYKVFNCFIQLFNHVRYQKP